MQNEELLQISSSYQSVQGKRKNFFRRNITIFAIFGFVLFIGTACSVLYFNQESISEQPSIITRTYQPTMQQYSRVLSVEVSTNSDKVSKKIESENMIMNFYPIKKNLIAIEVVDQQSTMFDKSNIDIRTISHKNFQHDVHKPQTELYYLVLDTNGQFSKLLAESTVSESELEKVKHIVQQYTPELNTQLYSTPKQYIRPTKLGQAKVQHEKIYEDNNKVIVKHTFNGDDVSKTSSMQNFDSNTYQFEQTHHFSKETNNLELSDLHENYKFETAEHDMMQVGLKIQTHQKLELLKTKPISENKINELIRKYYAMEDTSRKVFTLQPNELKHTSDFEFAQSIKDQLFPGSASCPVKERSLQQANDNIQMLTNQTFTVYNHPQQSFLGFSFQIIDEISIYVDLTNSTLIFDNSLVLQIQRDSCFKQFTLIEFSVPMTTNFTWDINMIEVAAEAWLENLEDFFQNIYNKFQDFLKKIKAEGIHSNSSWTGIDSNSSRRLDSLKGDLDQIEGDLSKWNQDIINVLSHTSKQYHYSKPISYEYNLDFYGITLQFSFGFTFGLDGSYEDNLLQLYTYNKQVLINYINILEQDYNQDLQTAESMYKNLTALLTGCQQPSNSKEFQNFKNWKCQEDETELDYICSNSYNKQNIHVTEKYYKYMQNQLSAVSNECITTAVKDLMTDIINQLKSFWQLRQTQFLNLLNLTYVPQFKGDVYVTGYMKITLVPWLNKLSMSIKLEGDLLQATADLSISINVIPFFTNLVQLVEENISPYDYLQDVESAISFNFDFDVQVVNVTLTWIAAEAVVDLILDVAEVIKSQWSQHGLRNLQVVHQNSGDDSIFSDVFSDAASKFEQGLENVIADIYCEFFSNAEGIAEAFTPESIPLYQFLWANAGCSLPATTLQNFQTSMIQCSYSTDFQVIQLWDPSKYQTS